jgi:hypothetical protein
MGSTGGGFFGRLRKPSVWAPMAVLGVAACGAGVYWFEPHKAFVDATVSEAPRPDATIVAEGAFRSLEHETTGRAKILRTADGGRILRLEDLATSNGPQLVVMLSDTPATHDGWSAYDDGAFVVLEPLKGNRGSQNYEIPPAVELERYRSAVVWCQRFSVAFGAAPIE